MTAKSSIRILSEHTINKIAAGEVIENSASVVKELVENALDAAATDICVEIRGGGRQLIRVSDNGFGMTHDDALLCLERHATSKIREVEDIQDMSSMGFRGEAIPSIASISKFMILTRPKEPFQENGTLILVDGGKIISCGSAARSPGTTIEVKSLFFNVPVRQKFQRSPNHDTQEVQKILGALALGYPAIKFTLISDEKLLLNTHLDSSENPLAARIPAVLGKEYFTAMRRVELHRDPYRIEGYIGDPSYSRHNKTGQHLFINRRAVSSSFISYAVREGYGPTLPSQRYPVFVLHLQMPGLLVDVNVHPQKKEVRLRQEHELKQHLMEAIQKSLQDDLFSTPFCCESPAPFSVTPFPSADKEPIKENLFISAPTFAKPTSSWAAPKSFFTLSTASEIPIEIPIPASQNVIPQVLGTLPGIILADAKSLGRDEGICLIDQKAASARIHYEHLLRGDHKSISSQLLLIPIIMDFSKSEAALIQKHLPMLIRIGFAIQEIGPETFSIESHPSSLTQDKLKDCIIQIVYDLDELHDNRHLERKEEKRLAYAASRMALSGDKKLSMDEAIALVKTLSTCKSALQCPMGKPIFTYVSTAQLKGLIL